MLTNRIIACLDVMDGRVVKGTGFVDLRDAGDPVVLAEECEALGADEILLTSIDRDGARSGYDIELVAKVSRAVQVPVVASGGAGCARDVADAFILGGADAALLAGILHDGTTNIRSVKSVLQSAGIPVRTAA